MAGNTYRREYQVFLEHLSAARRRSGLSQRDVASKLGAPRSYVAKVEIGDQRMDIYEILSYLVAVDFPFLEFMQQYYASVQELPEP